MRSLPLTVLKRIWADGPSPVPMVPSQLPNLRVTARLGSLESTDMLTPWADT